MAAVTGGWEEKTPSSPPCCPERPACLTAASSARKTRPPRWLKTQGTSEQGAAGAEVALFHRVTTQIAFSNSLCFPCLTKFSLCQFM